MKNREMLLALILTRIKGFPYDIQNVTSVLPSTPISNWGLVENLLQENELYLHFS